MGYDLTAQFTQTVLTEAFSAESRRMSMMPQKEGVIIHLAGDLKPLPIFDMPSAPISISIDGKWAKNPPKIFTPVRWLCPVFPEQDQVVINWHRYSDRTLCWIKYDEWRDICGLMATLDSANSAAYQLVRNVQVLLLAHWVSYINHLKKWPKDLWLQREHGNLAKERKQNG